MIKINFRPLFNVALSLIIGIICLSAFNFLNNAIGIVALVFLLVFLVLSLLTFIFGFIKVNNKFFNYVSKFKRASVCVLVGISIALISFYVVLTNFNNKLKINNAATATVSGTISEVNVYDNYMVLKLDNLKINDKAASGKLELGVTKGDNFSVSNFSLGNNVSFNSEVSYVKAGYNNVYKMIKNIKYSANSYITEVNVSNGTKSLKVSLKQNVYNNLTKVLNEDNSGLAYSMLFGEKENLNNDVYSIFSYSGLAHILAVSGLHIGFLVVLIVGLLNLLKCNKHVRNVLVFLILLFYAYLTNFSPSVVRALIMSMVLLLSKTYLKEYDALSSLSLACIIILLISPFTLFTVGFQLSFACVFSIITLSDDFKKLLLKIKCPTFLANALSISVAVNIGVFAITAVHFKTISFISVFSNLIVLPLFEICYIFLFLFGFIGAITPILNFMLVLPNVILHFIKLIANFFANINILNLEVFHVSYVVVLLMLLILYLTKFVIAKNRLKIIVGSVLITLVCVLTITTNLPINYNQNNLMLAYSRYGNNALITTTNNEKILVVNNLIDIKPINNLMVKAKVKKVDAIICYDYNVKDNFVINNLITKYKPNKCIFETETSTYVLREFINYSGLVFYDGEFNLYGVNFNFVKNDHKTIGLSFNINNCETLLVTDKISKYDIIYFSKDYNLIVSNNNNIDFNFYNVVYENLLTYKPHKNSSICLLDLEFFTKKF